MGLYKVREMIVRFLLWLCSKGSIWNYLLQNAILLKTLCRKHYHTSMSGAATSTERQKIEAQIEVVQCVWLGLCVIEIDSLWASYCRCKLMVRMLKCFYILPLTLSTKTEFSNRTEQNRTQTRSIKTVPPTFMSVTPCDFCSGDHGDLKCSRCRCVFYCSQACQKKDWKEHKKQCDLIVRDVAQGEQKLLQVMQHRNIVKNSSNMTCASCSDVVGDTPLALPCGHVFCRNCPFEHQETCSLFTFSCSICGKDVSGGLCAYVCNNVTLLMGMAYRNPEESQEYCQLARKELSILKYQSFPVLSLNAELLYLEGKYEEAIAAALAYLPFQLLPTDTELLRTIIKSCIGWKKYGSAIKYIEKLILIVSDPTFNDRRHDENYAYHKASVCFYHVGAYKDAIDYAQYALDCNRHFENVHRYMALSQRALGQLDEAVLTIRRAVRYEEPWHEEHTQRCQEKLNELLAEQQQQQQQQQSVEPRQIQKGDEKVEIGNRL